jgi:hypothetical protein
MLEHLLLPQHGDVFVGGHGKGSGEEPRDTGQDQNVRLDRGPGHAHDEAGVGHEPVIDAEDARSERPAAERLVALSDLLDRSGHGVRLRLRIAAIDRHAPDLRG